MQTHSGNARHCSSSLFTLYQSHIYPRWVGAQAHSSGSMDSCVNIGVIHKLTGVCGDAVVLSCWCRVQRTLWLQWGWPPLLSARDELTITHRSVCRVQQRPNPLLCAVRARGMTNWMAWSACNPSTPQRGWRKHCFSHFYKEDQTTGEITS